MKHIVEKHWMTGSNQQIDFYKMLNLLQEHIISGSKVFIGSDSYVSNNKTCFATAVCLHGGEKQSRYFFFKDFVHKNHFSNLVNRITEEVRRSLEISSLLVEEYNFDPKKIELHLDVSQPHAGEGTSRYSEMLKGYVQGYGLEYRLKPDAWASQSVADRHSK